MSEEKAIALDKLARALNKLRDTGLPLNNWQADKKYKVNYPVLHENKIYRCTEEHTASSTFDETKWEAVSNADSGLKTWGENTLYKTGDIVIYGNGIYQCITEHTSTSTFDNTKWTNLSIGYAKKSLYTSTTYNTASTTITTSESMLNKDFIIIKIAYSIDGTYVKMNKSYVIAPVVGEVHDFSYQESTTSYIALTGKILNNNTLQFDFTEAQNITKFKVISIDSLSLGTGEGNAVYSDTPIGTIISYMGNNPPKDYLSCNGTVYNISDYQALADFINTEFGSYDFFGGDGITTFAVPDLRGEFLRGTGTNSHTNNGNGSNVGVHQDGTLIPELQIGENNILYAVRPSGNANNYSQGQDYIIKQSSPNNRLEYTASSVYDSGGDVNMKFTSRPTNTSVLYCIKYTNSNSPEKIDIWTANTSYSVGNIVIYDDKIYRCITENNDATFTPLNWVCLSATGEEDIGHITFGYELQSGYLPLDGSAYNRADYADLINWVEDNILWASTSTDYGKFGTGDGTTTFTTPNFTGKFIECDNSTNVGGYTSSSSIYSDSVNTVQPESIKLIPQIKYRKPNKSLPVKAVRRTLFEGSVGNFTGLTSSVQINLLDDFTSYDVIGFYISVNWVGNKRYIYREVTKEQLLAVQNSSNHDDAVSFNWGYSNADDYCDILYNSTSRQLICNINKQIVTKVVGIKYINENQYSTEEQLIGTWIDGKPLYQKTLVKTGGVSNNVAYFKDELPNINYLQKTSASFITNLNRYESEYNNDSNDKLQTLVYVNSNNVGVVYTLFAYRTVSEMYVTVQYTKTTD